MYNIDNLPTFTYAGAMKPKTDYGTIIRNAALIVAAIILVIANM